MKPLLLAFAIATVGSVLYHLGQKLVPPAAHPLAVLMAAYAVAFTLSLAALSWLRPVGATAPWRQAFAGMATGPGLRVALLLGVGVLLIEVGFLLAYRAGGSLQWSGVAVNGAAAVLLLPIAVLAFKEPFSLPKAAGILLVLAGLALLTRR
jgi:drug/metabolite transporter (DMT)-like permease